MMMVLGCWIWVWGIQEEGVLRVCQLFVQFELIMGCKVENRTRGNSWGCLENTVWGPSPPGSLLTPASWVLHVVSTLL